MRFMTFEGTMNVDTFEDFMSRLMKEFNEKIFLIVDNLKVHHALCLAPWLEERKDKIELHYLPSYSPELNPDEYMNRDLKAHLAEQDLPTSKLALKQKVELHMENRKDDPEAIRKLFGKKRGEIRGGLSTDIRYGQHNKSMRNPVYDIARALCVLYMVGFYHLANYSDFMSAHVQCKLFGHAGTWTLGAFILLSSLCLGTRYPIESRQDAFRFYRKRVILIIPPFALALLVMPNSHVPLKAIGWKLAALTGLSNFLPCGNVPTLWFVSMMVVFYVLFPIISSNSVRRTVAAGIAIEIVFVLGCRYAGWDLRLFQYWPGFVTGVLLARFDGKRQTAVVLVGSLLALLLLLLLPPMNDFTKTLVAFSGGFVVLGVSRMVFCSRKPHVFWKTAAYASMGAYMFHRPVYGAFYHLGFPDDGMGRIAFLVFVCLPAVFIVGYCVQKSYDAIIAVTAKRTE